MPKRYLVTGCAGFIGSRVAELLLEAGHRVVGVDNINDAYDPRLKQWRLEQLAVRADFQFHRLDIADRNELGPIFEDAGPEPFDAVINLAARAGVRTSVEDPWIYLRTNSTGTLNLLDQCRRRGVKKFLLASTSSLYGTHNRVPYTEDAATDQPLSPYAASKKAAEAMAYTYHYLHGIDVSVMRYFTVYGPGGRPDMSVFRFVRRIAEDEPIVVFGDGSQNRDWTFIDDIARGTIAALRPLGYEIINLGGDKPVKLSSVIQQIGDLLDKQPKIEYQPAHPADVPGTWANVDKAHELLGWSPQVGIEEGLARSVQWYRDNRQMILPLELGDRQEDVSSIRVG